jgi:DNA repair exonuclease SbcCD nuclease subunit
MKIAVLSDLHFGFAHDPELEEDSFENANEAITKCLDADLILIPGDLFDTRTPKTSVWAKAVKILVTPLLKESSGLNIIQSDKELEEISKRCLRHIPVVALHGTHERRSKGEVNVIEALEHAGVLIHLHCNTIVFEKNGKKIAIHGMSGVPERFAKDVLYRWHPQPVKDCFNILMIHQSIDPYIYSPLEPPTISLSNLPKGFDVIIDGHLHSHSQEKIGDTVLLFPGSTVTTQMEKSEATIEKGVYSIDLNGEIKIEFRPLGKNRKFFYKEVGVENCKEEIERKLNEILKGNFEKKPIVKIKIKGEELKFQEEELRNLENKFSDRVVMVFAKELEKEDIMQKVEFLRSLREERKSIEEIGTEILKKNLDQLGFEPSFDYEQLFNLLSENQTEKIFNILAGEQKTLVQSLKVDDNDNQS